MQAQQREAAEGMIARACVLVDHGMMEEASALLARAALAYQQVYMCPHTTRLRAPSLLEPLSPTSRYICVLILLDYERPPCSSRSRLPAGIYVSSYY